MKTWTPVEVQILIENYNVLPNSELDALFPNKTHYAIYKKAYSLGLRKEAEIEFKNRSEVRKKEKGSNWKGGVRVTKEGYRQVLAPGHHRADVNGYVMEHILNWELATGVAVPKSCCIHHINGNKQDNRIENLCMMSVAAHTAHHHIGAKRSDATKAKLSKSTKTRLANKENHPMYKPIDLNEMQVLIDKGMTVKDACNKFGIDRTTYYRKRRMKNA